MEEDFLSNGLSSKITFSGQLSDIAYVLNLQSTRSLKDIKNIMLKPPLPGCPGYWYTYY